MAENVKKQPESIKRIVRTLLMPAIVIAVAIVLDQVTKAALFAWLGEGCELELIPKFLYFTLHWNDGAAFGSFSGARWFFVVLTSVAMLVFLYVLYRMRDEHVTGKIALALVIGGGIGNLIDRIAFGAVRDFIHFVYFGLDLPLLGESFAIFNVADMALTIGVVFMLVYFVVFYYDKKDPKAVAEHVAKLAKKQAMKLQKQDARAGKGVMSVDEYLKQIELGQAQSQQQEAAIGASDDNAVAPSEHVQPDQAQLSQVPTSASDTADVAADELQASVGAAVAQDDESGAEKTDAAEHGDVQ